MELPIGQSSGAPSAAEDPNFSQLQRPDGASANCCNATASSTPVSTGAQQAATTRYQTAVSTTVMTAAPSGVGSRSSASELRRLRPAHCWSVAQCRLKQQLLAPQQLPAAPRTGPTDHVGHSSHIHHSLRLHHLNPSAAAAQGAAQWPAAAITAMSRLSVSLVPARQPAASLTAWPL